LIAIEVAIFANSVLFELTNRAIYQTTSGGKQEACSAGSALLTGLTVAFSAIFVALLADVSVLEGTFVAFICTFSSSDYLEIRSSALGALGKGASIALFAKGMAFLALIISCIREVEVSRALLKASIVK
jgi:hypothetical protein